MTESDTFTTEEKAHIESRGETPLDEDHDDGASTDEHAGEEPDEGEPSEDETAPKDETGEKPKKKD